MLPGDCSHFQFVGEFFVTTSLPHSTRLVLAGLILASCIGCDQATKTIATQSLKNTPPRLFLAGTIRLEYALNPGGFLSLGHNIPEPIRTCLFIVCNVGTMAAISGFLFFRRTLDWKLFTALSFILAGGIGNLIDRVTNNGFVTDFINVGIGPVRTGIFNVADMAVMFGGFALVYLTCSEPPAEQSLALETVTDSKTNPETIVGDE
jgi:signal peptidase II